MSTIKANTFQAVTSNSDISIEGQGTGGVKANARVINAQTGTTYTLVLADAGKVITMTSASANTLTIPLNSSVAFNVGTQIDIFMGGAGVTTVTGAASVTLNGTSAGGAALDAIYKAVSVVKIATDTWIMAGAHGAVA
jgi:hypothetical protein